MYQLLAIGPSVPTHSSAMRPPPQVAPPSVTQSGLSSTAFLVGHLLGLRAVDQLVGR